MNPDLHQPEIQSFVNIARQYCDWVDMSPADSVQEMEVARKLLAKLHTAVLQLPDLGVKNDTVSNRVSGQTWKKIYERFSKMPVHKYWDVFDPLNEQVPVCGTLADDIADIYHDIKNPLLLFDEGNVIDAVWEWRFSFHYHWGHHLTGAQRAIHCYFANEESKSKQ